MADAKPPSTTDLLLLIFGLQLLKTPDANAQTGEEYYLDPPKLTEERTLRDSTWDALFLLNPSLAWSKVKFRDWLITTLFGNITDHKHDFNAISEPVICSMDLLGKEFDRYVPGVTDAIKEALLAESGLERAYFSTLTFGISKQIAGGKEVFLFGAGMRRRAQLWLTGEEAIQVDTEFYVPFFILPNHNHDAKVSESPVRSLCAGISVKNTKGHALGMHDGKELTDMRFNLRIPFKVKGDKELETEFGNPEINIQRKIKDGLDWEKFEGWKEFLENYCERKEIGDLLNSPMGPLLSEKISDGSGVTDLILKQSKRDEIKANLPQFKKDLDETLDLLRHTWEWKEPDKKNPQPELTDEEEAGPHSGSRKLGSLLQSLGFMSAKAAGDGNFDYSFKLASNLTAWSVLNHILDELDGFPLYVGGLDSKKDKYNRIAVSLASQSNLSDSTKKYFGIAGLAYNILLNPVPKEENAPKDDDSEQPSIVLSDDYFSDDDDIFIDIDDDDEEEQSEPEQTNEKKSKVDVLLQLGKWFSNETLDDNWMLRLLPKTDEPGKQTLPLPGIRVLPFKRTASADHTKANFSWTLLVDLLSLGIDIQGKTKEGLTFIQGLAGHFGLGAVEVRLTIKLSFDDFNTKQSLFDHFVFGVGVKLKDMRLSLGPKEEKKEKDSGDEIIAGIQKSLGDDWAILPPTESKERTVKTRLSAKKKDKFSISIGYLSPLKDGGNSTLDIQLYDEKGNRGKMVLIPIDRGGEPVYLKQIGIALKGVENVEIRKGLPDSAQLTVALTGGIRLPAFELGFIGAKLTFQLNNPSIFEFGLDGLDVSLKIGPVIISGSFMKIGIEYAGSLTVSIPKGSFSAMGFFGSLLLFDFASETDTIRKLNVGTIPANLNTKLLKEKITPVTNMPVRLAQGGGWELHTTDDKQYKIETYENKFIVLRPDKTFFVYVTLSAASGTGITVGPIQFTGIVFGYGFNRRAKIPTIEKVADFPLVKIVMGQGGYQSEDETFELHNQLAKPVEDPIAIFEKMKSHLVPELGQQFACGGVRFTIAGTIDCFALIVVQWGNELEISLLGLARFRLPRDTTARAICYIELQILMTLKPSEGTFKLQALLSNNSWVITSDCKLTGGFALFVWFDGEHKGDIVVTLGGYHPRFRRPDHYPIVPRLGLNWPVNDNLSIKGGIYLAYTPSCGMLGARLEAAFHSGRISAWFTAYLDVIINWDPPYFEAEIGISLRVEARFFVFSISLTIAASVEMWGPPVGGVAHIDLTIIKFDIKFNNVPRRTEPELIKTWQEFCHKFLNLSGGDTRALKEPVAAFPIVQPNLAAGRNNLNNLPNARRQETKPKPEDEIWRVRADELELAAAATVPVTTMNFGKVKTNSPPEGVQNRSMSGRSMMIAEPVKLEEEGLSTRNSANKVGAHAMGKGITSVLNVTIVRDEVSIVEAVDVNDWTMEEEIGNLPAAVWEPGEPNMRPTEPTAKLIEGCITGLKRLKPPRGKLGKKAAPPPLEWHVLEKGKVAQSTTAQRKPAGTGARNIQTVVAQKQADQKNIVAALSSAGFSLSWQPVPQADVRMRELQADPLAGAVA